MALPCTCEIEHPPRLVVVTGGPGAGKTALLEVAQRLLCRHVIVLPEAASILWRGQFPRHSTLPGRKAAQRAIVRLQLEMQRMTIEEGHAALILCDRGTLDGLAYWPGTEAEYFDDTGTTRQRELARYATVIHLQPPGPEHGYLPSPLRIETAAEAAALDERIGQAWSGHPRRFVVESDDDFVRKLHRALDLIAAEVPGCCRAALVSGPREVGPRGVRDPGTPGTRGNS
ncbi:MAG TPA: ATP-binding protein [Kofleriaceae bacterium]|nr:ATP-binding protein [Kofleriaceae bacterium]